MPWIDKFANYSKIGVSLPTAWTNDFIELITDVGLLKLWTKIILVIMLTDISDRKFK